MLPVEAANLSTSSSPKEVAAYDTPFFIGELGNELSSKQYNNRNISGATPVNEISRGHLPAVGLIRCIL